MYKNKHSIVSILIAFFILHTTFLTAQTQKYNWKGLFHQSYYIGFKNSTPLRQQWINLSNSKGADDMESLSYGLDAVLAMYETTDSIAYLDDAITLTNNVLYRAQITKNINGNKFPFKDNYKGWIGGIPNGYQYQQEVVLSEINLFQYVTRLLKDLHNNKVILKKSKYKEFYNKTLTFVELNIWDKWKERGIRYSNDKFYYFSLSRTHMASHWAYIAAELSFLTSDQDRKIDCIDFVNLYNNQLENNFNKDKKYLYWNQTWDSILGDKRYTSIIQDVSHGNLVVSYIIEANSLGLWKDTSAIYRIINTLKDKLWDPQHCLFRDNMDGTMFKPGQNGSVGSFQADGFVKLTRFDKNLFSIYENFVSCSPLLLEWNQHGQLFANLALSQKLLESSN
jgi:hypothetical protein